MGDKQHSSRVAAILAKVRSSKDVNELRSVKHKAQAGAISSFREQQARAAELMDAAARERDARLAGAGKKKAPPTKAASRRAASSGAAGSQDGATASGGPSGSGANWKKEAAAPKGQLPLGAKIKRVLDYLRGCERPQTAREVSTATQLTLSADRALREALATNPKVEISAEGLYTYKPEVANVRNREQLLAYLRRREAAGEGFACWKDLEDSYLNVGADLEVLKREGQIFALYSHAPEVECEVYYPVDQRLAGLAVHEDVQLLWQTIGAQVPEDEEDVQDELKKLKLKPAPRRAPRKRGTGEKQKKKRARRQMQLRAVTNVHLMELLQGEMPTSIEQA